MGNENIEKGEEQEIVQQLSPEQQETLVKNELAVIPEADRKEIEKVVKTADIVLIDSHKKKIRSFKARFPAKKYPTENIVFTKEALEKATEQWREVKNYRTKTAEPEFKALKAPYTAITKFYNDQCNPIIEELKLIEQPISKYIDKLEELEKAEKEKEKNRLEALANERRDKLLEAGMAFDGNHYVIGSEEFEVPQISFDMADIQSLTDAIFERALANVAEAHKIITEKTEEKKQKEAEAETKRLAEEQAEKTRNAELAAENLRKENQLKEEEAEMKKKRIEFRGEALEGIGFTHDSVNKHYSFGSRQISENDVAEFDKQNWDNWLNEAKKGIAQYRKVKARVAELESIGLVFNDQKKEYQYEGIAVSTHYIDEATDGGWEECIVDTKQKIEAIKQLGLLKEERHNQLLNVGLHCEIKFSGYSYKKNGFDVSSHLKNDTDAEWLDFINNFIVKNINAINTAIETQGHRFSILAPYASYGTQVDMNLLYKMSDTEWNSILEEKKAAYNKKLQDDIDETNKKNAKKKADELAAASDSTKWAAFVDHLKNAPVLEMESDEYKAKYQNALLVLIDIVK